MTWLTSTIRAEPGKHHHTVPQDIALQDTSKRRYMSINPSGWCALGMPDKFCDSRSERMARRQGVTKTGSVRQVVLRRDNCPRARLEGASPGGARASSSIGTRGEGAPQ